MTGNSNTNTEILPTFVSGYRHFLEVDDIQKRRSSLTVFLQSKLSSMSQDPQDVMDFLRNPQDFPKFSYTLKRFIALSMFVNYDEQQGELDTFESTAKELGKRILNTSDYENTGILQKLTEDIKALDSRSCREWLLTQMILTRVVEPDEKDKMRENIGNWLGDTPLKKEDLALKLCFALRLDASTARDLLVRAGINAFNFMNLKHAVFAYSLDRHLSFSEATEAYNTILTNSLDSCPENDEHPLYSEYNSLTQIFADTLPQAFDQDPHNYFCLLQSLKNEFKGYSYSAFKKYLEFKENIIDYIVEAEFLAMKLRKESLIELGATPLEAEKAYSIDADDSIHGIRTYLFNTVKDDQSFESLRQKLGKKGVPENTYWKELKDLIRLKCKSTNDFPELVFGAIVSNDRLIARTYAMFLCMYKRDPSNLKKWTVNRKNIMQNGIPAFQGMPLNKYLGDYDRHPELLSTTSGGRQALFLLYLFSYAASNNPYKDFHGFYCELVDLSENCGLAYPYEGNQFDWLLLECARLFDSDISADGFIGYFTRLVYAALFDQGEESFTVAELVDFDKQMCGQDRLDQAFTQAFRLPYILNT